MTKLVTIYVTVPYERNERMNIADAQARHYFKKDKKPMEPRINMDSTLLLNYMP